MNIEEVTKLALERGFFFPSCEIYSNAPAGFWDYGPLGLALRRRFVELWRREIVRRDGMIEIDGSQVMARDVFVASGHLESFTDPLVECTECGSKFRADKLIEEKAYLSVPEKLRDEELDKIIDERGLSCLSCGGKLGKVNRFNMMFRINIGASGEEAYLRPETCQSIFVSFPRLYRIMRLKLPIGIAQVGKSFRNEISPRQSIIRLREFYQAEVEVFFNPSKADRIEKFNDLKDYTIRLMPLGSDCIELTVGEAYSRGFFSSKIVAYYLALLQRFYEIAGMPKELIRIRQLSDEERAFYSKEAWDLEVKTSIGWLELVACNNRSNYDLSGHGNVSKHDMTVIEDDEKVLPNIFELSMGIDRSIYAILELSFKVEDGRRVLKVPQYLAPIQVAVFPLVVKDGLPEKAKEVYDMLKLDFDADYDESGSIGRRYRRQDEIGTPYCITIDYQTLSDKTVTIRNRDDMAQKRVNIDRLQDMLNGLLTNKIKFKDIG